MSQQIEFQCRKNDVFLVWQIRSTFMSQKIEYANALKI